MRLKILCRELNRKKYIWTELILAVVLAVLLGITGALLQDGEGTVSAESVLAAEREDEETEVQTAEADSGSAETEEETEETIADGQYPIMGTSSVTAEEMAAYFQTGGVEYPSEALSKGGAATLEVFCQMYYEEAAAEGVRAEVAFAQMLKETAWLQYGGDASIEQFNFAGIGTTGNGVAGNSYADVQTGIRAQIQHLKAYATTDPLVRECVDERYEYVIKGSAPYVQWLGKNENPEGQGWATADDYGYSIVEMIYAMKSL